MTQSQVDQIANSMSESDIANLYDLLCHSYGFEVMGGNQLRVVGLDSEHTIDDDIRAIIRRFKSEFIALSIRRLSLVKT
jgi:hypothetical protein